MKTALPTKLLRELAPEGNSMTLTAEPNMATTGSGASLPPVALPERELLVIDEKNIPLIIDSLSAGVHVKPLRLNIQAGW